MIWDDRGGGGGKDRVIARDPVIGKAKPTTDQHGWALHKNQNLTADNTDNTDLHG
jgi:hypothetical protein